MNKTLKILLFTGLFLILVGGIVFLVVFVASGGNMDILSNVRIEEKRFEESAPIDDITIDFENAAIEVRVEENISDLVVEYPQAQRNNGENISEITLTETDGALSIVEKRKWQLNLISWDFTSPKVVLHLPSDRTYDLSLTTKNGKISFDGEDLHATSVRLFTDNGTIETATTEISCSEAFLCETDNGAIKFIGNIKAHEFTVETDNGAIQGENAVIYAEKITLSTAVGGIRAKIAGKKENYTITVEHDVGDTNIHSSTGGEKILSVHSDVGGIQIDFVE